MPILPKPDKEKGRRVSMDSARNKPSSRYHAETSQGKSIGIASVTEQLKKLGLSPSFDGAPSEILEEKTTIGSQVHEAMKALCSDKSLWMNIDISYIPDWPEEYRYIKRTERYWRSLMHWFVRYRNANPGYQILSVEGSYVMVAEGNGSGKYSANLAGTWDLFAYNKSKSRHELKDIKLGKRHSSHRVQLAMYCWLIAFDDRYPMIDPFNCRDIWRTNVMVEEEETYELLCDDPQEIEIAVAAVLLHGFISQRKKPLKRLELPDEDLHFEKRRNNDR